MSEVARDLHRSVGTTVTTCKTRSFSTLKSSYDRIEGVLKETDDAAHPLIDGMLGRVCWFYISTAKANFFPENYISILLGVI